MSEQSGKDQAQGGSLGLWRGSLQVHISGERWGYSEAYGPAGSTGLLSTIVVAFREFKTLFLKSPCGTTALLKLDIMSIVPAVSLSTHLCCC